MGIDLSKYQNWDQLVAAINATNGHQYLDETPNSYAGSLDGHGFAAEGGQSAGVMNYDDYGNSLGQTPERAATNYNFGRTSNGYGTNVGRNPDGSINQSDYRTDEGIPKELMIMASLPFAFGGLAGALGGAGAAAGGGAAGAFDLGGIAGGVAGAGGPTGLGSAFGLGDAALGGTLAGAPSAYDLASIGDGTGMSGSFAHTAADAATGASEAAGAAPAFSDAGYAAQYGIDPSYVGSGTATGGGFFSGLSDGIGSLFGGAGSSMAGGIGSGIGKGLGSLLGAAAPGVIGSLLNKTPNIAAPDYAGAVNAQGAANAQAALNSSKLSNPNINTPYGSQTVQYGLDGDPNHATINQTLSPAQQALFDQQNAISKGMGNLAQNSIGQVASSLSQPFNQAALPPPATSGGAGWQRAFDSIIQRNQPLMERDQAALDTRLSNQGIFGGSEAYSNAQRDQATKVNDFRLGAQQNAQQQEQSQFGIDSQARQDAITQQNFFRTQPLNELNALRSGSQVTNPTFQPYQGSTQTAAPVFAGAQAQNQFNQNQYNATTASNNALTSGLFGLGASTLSAPKNTFGNLFSFGS